MIPAASTWGWFLIHVIFIVHISRLMIAFLLVIFIGCSSWLSPSRLLGCLLGHAQWTCLGWNFSCWNPQLHCPYLVQCNFCLMDLLHVAKYLISGFCVSRTFVCDKVRGDAWTYGNTEKYSTSNVLSPHDTLWRYSANKARTHRKVQNFRKTTLPKGTGPGVSTSILLTLKYNNLQVFKSLFSTNAIWVLHDLPCWSYRKQHEPRLVFWFTCIFLIRYAYTRKVACKKATNDAVHPYNPKQNTTTNRIMYIFK